MAKLPTTWTKLNLEGFKVSQDQVPSKGISRQMVDMACDILAANQIAIRNRTVQVALKEIYGIGGSATDVCNFLKEWRLENTAALKEGKNDKDLVSAILESVDDGLVADEEIPEEFLTISKQMALATYRLAFQNADTAISGDRLRQLTVECDTLRQQLNDYPQTQLELGFYKTQYERQQAELKDAYMQLNQQKLADSHEFQQRLDSLTNQSHDLQERLALALAKNKEFESAEHNAATIAGELRTRENELTDLKQQLAQLHEQLGQKEASVKQLAETKQQLDTANQTITQLQSQSRQSNGLEVDVDVDALLSEKEDLEFKLHQSQHLLSELQNQLEESYHSLPPDVIQKLVSLSESITNNISVIGNEEDSEDYSLLTVDYDEENEDWNEELNSKSSKSRKQKQPV